MAEEAAAENSSLCRIWESIYMACDKVKNTPKGKESTSVMHCNYVVHFSAFTSQNKEKISD